MTSEQVKDQKAVIYVRTASRMGRADDDSYEPQLSRCAEFGLSKHYTIVHCFKDHASGLTAKRPALDSLLTFLRESDTRGVVVIIDDVSRLARDVKVRFELRKLISQAGGRLEILPLSAGEAFA